MRWLVRIGLPGKDPLYLLNALEDRNIIVDITTKGVLEVVKYTLLKEIVSFNVVTLRVSDLGFRGTPPTTKQVFHAAEEAGYTVGPSDLGPLLQLQCPIFRRDGPFVVASKPIRYECEPRLFVINSDSLQTVVGGPKATWNPTSTFAFTVKSTQ